MSLQFTIYFSFLLFLLGLFGILYFKNYMSHLLSLQLIIISGGINFLGFSKFLYQETIWDKIFIFIGIISIYLLVFLILFYGYSRLNDIYKEIELEDYRLFRIDKSDWWGDEHS